MLVLIGVVFVLGIADIIIGIFNLHAKIFGNQEEDQDLLRKQKKRFITMGVVAILISLLLLYQYFFVV